MNFYKRIMILFLGVVLLTPVSVEAQNDYYKNGLRQLDADEPREAYESFQQAILEDETFAPAYEGLAQAQLALSTEPESIARVLEHLNRATELDPDLISAYATIAQVYMDHLEDMDAAEKNLEKALELNEMDVKSNFVAAWFYLLKREKPEVAITHFKKVLQVVPDIAQAYYGMGLSYIKAGKGHLAMEPISILRTMKNEQLAAALESNLNAQLAEKRQTTQAPQQALPPQGQPIQHQHPAQAQ